MTAPSALFELLGQARRRTLTALLFEHLSFAVAIAFGAGILLVLLGTQIFNWYWPVLLFAVALGLWMSSADPLAAVDPLTVTILSSRPEMVSGGDALVEIRSAPGTQSNVSNLSRVSVRVNDRDVSAAFHVSAERRSLASGGLP